MICFVQNVEKKSPEITVVSAALFWSPPKQQILQKLPLPAAHILLKKLILSLQK